MIGFYEQVVKNYKTTGAVGPSSPALARVMTRSLRDHTAGPKRVLEVGPGTGAFTRHILNSLRPYDSLDIIEINPAFCGALEKSLLRDYREQHPAIAIRLMNCSVQEAPLSGEYDFIVCGLPFNLFPLHEVSSIFRKLLSHLHNGGELTYFEYVGMKVVKMPWVGGGGRKRLRRRVAVSRVLDRRHEGSRELVLANFPPAHAIRLRR